MGSRRSEVAFWRLFPHLEFKRKPTGKSTGGHWGSTRGLQEVYRRRSRAVFTILMV